VLAPQGAEPGALLLPLLLQALPSPPAHFKAWVTQQMLAEKERERQRKYPQQPRRARHSHPDGAIVQHLEESLEEQEQKHEVEMDRLKVQAAVE
jgi:hypothetical protein